MFSNMVPAQEVFTSLSKRFQLVVQMIKRTVAGRYRGSILGMSWTLVYPIIMLGVYTFVFGVVFRSRWPASEDGGTAAFAVMLFAGLLIHQFFSECLSRAPGLITGNVQYVKKVLFPLEVLPWVAVGSALFQSCMSISILLAFVLFLKGALPWTVIFIPIVILPIALLAVGLVWAVSALSVYVRDISQVIGVLTTMLLFLSPIFYPIQILPKLAQALIYFNPLTIIIIQFRRVALEGVPPNFVALGLYAVVAFGVAWLSLSWFQRVRTGFADVL